MNYKLILILLLGISTGCQKDKVNSTATSCTSPDVQLTRTNEVVNEAPVMVVAVTSNSSQTNYRLIPANGVPWGSCNLPKEFARDSLKIYVSGYFLTFPGLEYMNFAPLPFEVTAARIR